MRSSLLIAVLFVLACTVSVSASSADWSAPESLWSSDVPSSELESRHSEFLMELDGSSSSTGPTEIIVSSSSAVAAPVIVMAPIDVVLGCDADPAATENKCVSEAVLIDTIKDAFNFPRLEGESFSVNYTSTTITTPDASSSAAAVASSSGAAAAASSSGVASTLRRLLATTEATKAEFDFVGSPLDGGVNARNVYAALVESLRCAPSETQTAAQCQDAVATKYSFPTGKLSASPAFIALAESVVPGTLVVDEKAVEGANQGLETEREQPTVGGPRDTNVGYYVLGAIVIAFILAALVYFIVHKKPVAAIAKEEPMRRDEIAMAPVVAAPVAGSGVVVAEEAPLAGQQQMDYRSVFALKHNVLDKSAEQKAAEEDEHNHNDVHFILHQ